MRFQMQMVNAGFQFKSEMFLFCKNASLSKCTTEKDVLKTERGFAFFSGHGQRTVLEALCATGAVKTTKDRTDGTGLNRNNKQDI